MCDCITAVTQVLREKTSDPKLEILISFDLKGRTYPNMTATYRKIKKDGMFRKYKDTMYLMPTFCPFCGEKYEQEERPTEPNGEGTTAPA